MKNLLPKRQKLTRGHHAAMPYADLPAFVSKLRERKALAALALEFTVLTAARSGEVYGARWSEIDLDAKVWTVPPNRTKAERRPPVHLVAVLNDPSRRAKQLINVLAGAVLGRHERRVTQQLRADFNVVPFTASAGCCRTGFHAP